MWLQHEFPYRKHFDRNKCIFIHIPKAAGTSVLAALGKKGEKGRDHVSWQTYKKADSKKFNNYFKFSFVRNPYDRALSAYNYILFGGNQGERDRIVAKVINEYADFNDFVERGLWKGVFRSHLLFLPQSSFVMDANDILMVDFLGHFETLEKDFKYVADQLGLNCGITHHNRGRLTSSESEDMAEMSQETREKLSVLYAQDFMNFGYDF
ncbi:sulfotransferase family 2 domain-containing protein [Cobetia sp. MMG027]|uniref:sulfotransferase family 2 domain-containing protein n=1 Tax=Cobetia sp. MMG027 TaxID=3021980 RepID=UPI0022FE9A12|nr:sulfotransferase family 2 domain-containing protein [Cobetia sp. MMG027]MDA5562758.1 sulfotransferase family 2 domain-containing protein [Cobetia sp. MMG027]